MHGILEILCIWWYRDIQESGKAATHDHDDACEVKTTKGADSTVEVEKKEWVPVPGGDVDKEDTNMPLDDILVARKLCTDVLGIDSGEEEGEEIRATYPSQR